MKTILILLDTLRKDYLEIYNSESNVYTPNITNFSQDANIFTNHCTGSLPCMPARRDLFTGKVDLFERFWGGLEPFDRVLQKELSINGISTHLITDHHHYWRHGGEGYMQYFDTYEMVRGQESDPWMSSVDGFQIPSPNHGRMNLQFEYNRINFKSKDDYPTMKTFNQACEFVEKNKNKDSFYLQIEGFDPHEPFIAPQEFFDIYNVNEGDISEFYNSPKYGVCTDSVEQLEHIISKYKANISFADYAFGKLIKKLKELEIYNECNIILTSDHGFHFGDHGVIGKGITNCYNELAQIPLIHKLPFQNKCNYVSALTQNICIFPTLVEQYGIKVDIDFDGKSYLECLSSKMVKCLDIIVTGYFGGSVTVYDGEYVFINGSFSNKEINIYTAMPTMMQGYIGSPYSHKISNNTKPIEIGRLLSRTDYPVFKFDASQFFITGLSYSGNELYLARDVLQVSKIKNEEIENIMRRKLKNKMLELKVPSEQFSRLNLNNIIDTN